MGAYGANYGSNFASAAILSVAPITKTVTADLCVNNSIKTDLCVNESVKKELCV